MRRLALAVTGLVWAAHFAAAGPLELYFSTSSALTAVPAEYQTGTIPSVAPGQPAYLWARVTSPDIWNGVSLGLLAPSNPSAGAMYNPSGGSGLRWNPGSDFDPTDADLELFAIVEQGLGATGDPLHVSDPTYGDHYLAGTVTYPATGSPCTVNLAVGSMGITQKGGAGATVFFGFTVPVPGPGRGGPDGPVDGGTVGATSAFPDLYVTPEPGALALLLAAGLVLRRRV